MSLDYDWYIKYLPWMDAHAYHSMVVLTSKFGYLSCIVFPYDKYVTSRSHEMCMIYYLCIFQDTIGFLVICKNKLLF